MKRLLSLAVLLGVAQGCGGSGGDPEAPRTPQRAGGARPDKVAAPPGVPTLASAAIATVPNGTYGPYLGSREGSTVAVWAALQGEQRKWFTRSLGATTEPLAVADAPKEIGLVVVRGAGGGGGSSPGFVVVTTRPGADGDLVEALALGPRGELRGGPAPLTENGDDVIWVEAVPTSKGTIALWAVRQADRADLYAVLIGASGERVGGATTVMRHARAWQAIRSEDGAAIGAVTAGVDPGLPGPLKLVFLDAESKVDGKPLIVSQSKTAELDVDLARIGGNYVMAWSDREHIEPRVVVAALDARGKPIKPPSPATEPRGEQALIGIVKPRGAGPAFLAWENVLERPIDSREVVVAPLSGDGTLGSARATIGIAATDGTLPELAATGKGIAALTLAPVCQRDADCADAESLPTYVELGASLDVVASEPMMLEALGGGAAAMSWALTCPSTGCIALAAEGTSPAKVFSVDLETRSSTWQPAATRAEAPPPPRMTGMEAVASAEPLSDVDWVRVGKTSLAAWVTYFNPSTPYERRKKPAPDGRFDPLRALLQLTTIAVDGAVAKPQTISLRARSLGGVALAAGAPARKEALLVWTAIDRKVPQVFTTLVGADGRKIQQKMLTRSKGEVSDVAVEYVGDDSWILAWVDERHGDPEVYVTKVNRLLQRSVPERRITNAKGAASSLTLLRRGDHVLVAWADARDSEKEGWADVFAARVKVSDASLIGDARRVAKTRLHSHSPVLAGSGDRAALAWIEDEPDALAAGDHPGAMLAILGPDGRLVGEPKPLRGTGTVIGVDIECPPGGGCRFALSSTIGERAALEVLTAGDTVKHRRIAWLGGPSAPVVAPVIEGGALLYADQKDKDGRVRRMSVDW